MVTGPKPPSPGGYLSSVCELFHSGLRLFDQTANGGGWLGTLGDPVIHLVEIEVGIAFFLGWIVGSKDVKEATIAGKTFVSGDNTEDVMPFGTFLTETNNYSHDFLCSNFFRGGGQ